MLGAKDDVAKKEEVCFFEEHRIVSEKIAVMFACAEMIRVALVASEEMLTRRLEAFRVTKMGVSREQWTVVKTSAVQTDETQPGLIRM